MEIRTCVLSLIFAMCLVLFPQRTLSLRITRSNSASTKLHLGTGDEQSNSTSHSNGTQSGDPERHSQKNCSGHDCEKSGIHLISLKYEYVEQPFIISVFLLAAGLAKLGFHHAHFISSRVPESCLLIIVGIIVGALMNKFPSTQTLPGLSSELFFLYLLPPIILESAYSLHDRTFYENVGTVLIFAVIGTVLNCFILGPTLFGIASVGAMGNISVNLKQSLVFSSIIVAVDPVAVLAIFQEVGVNNVLYFLVFGESLLNDAVTVVLYNMMKEFNNMHEVPVAEIFKGLLAFFITSLGGLSIGIVFGVLTAIITKYTGTVRVVEPLAVFVLAYTSYLMAEMFHFSGIISIIGCGLTQAQYAFHNISQKSHTTVKYFSKMISATSDCIIFLFLGIVLFRDDIQTLEHWKVGFILWSIFLCLLYRFIVVFGLTWLVNRSSKMRRIDNEEKFIMAYGGLRGAVAFSLMDLLSIRSNMSSETKAIFMTTCLSIIFFTVFVQGISIKPLVKLLRVRLQEEKELKLSEEINSHVTDHVMAGIEEVLGQHGEHYFRELLEFYNRKYVKRMLMKDPVSMDEQIMSCFEEIALQQHFENLAGSKMIQEKYSSHDELPFPEDQLPSKIAISLNDSIPEEEEEMVSSGEDSEEPVTILPAVTVLPPSSGPVRRVNDIRNEEMSLLIENDKARRKTVANARKKSIIPDFLRGKSERKPVSDEPTAKDLRAMFTPSRRMIQHRKLDKNIRDESSTDLLRFLQEKQNRTRRMSQAVGAFKFVGRDSTSPCSTPIGSDLHLNLPRKSIDAGVAMKNYRRRLSLAVPERPAFQRERSPSDITALKSHQNPVIPLFRKPKYLRRGHSCDDRALESKESSKALTPDAAHLGKSPSKVSKTSGFESITEHDEDESGHSLDDTKSTISSSSTASRSSHKFRRPKLQKSKTIDLCQSSSHDQIPMQRADTDPVEKKLKDRSKVKFKMEEELRKKKFPKKSKLEKSTSVDISKQSDSIDDEPRKRTGSLTELPVGSPQLRKASYTQAISSKEVDESVDDVEMKKLGK